MKRNLLALMLAGVPLASTVAADAPSREKLDDPLPSGVLVRLGTPRMRHTGKVGPVVFSPDGKRLASGDSDGVVRVWDVATGRQIRLLLGCQGYPNALAFSPDGKRLAAGGEGLRLWDLTTGKTLWTFPLPHGQLVNALAFSPDGNTLAVAEDLGSFLVLDAAHGKERFRVEGRYGSCKCCLGFAPNGGSLVVCRPDGLLRVWNLAMRKEKLCVALRPPFRFFFSVDFSTDGKTLRVSSAVHNKAEVQVIDAATGKIVRTRGFAPRGTQVAAVALSPDGKVGAASCRDGMVHLWNLETGKQLCTILGPLSQPSPMDKLVFSPDGQMLAVAGENLDQVIRLWNVATGKPIHRGDGHEAVLRAVVVSPDGSQIASAGDDARALLWDGSTGKLVDTFPASQAVRALAFSPDGCMLAVGDANGEARVWNVRSGKSLYRLHAPSCFFFALTFLPDGKSLVSGHASTFAKGSEASDMPGCLRVWDAATGQERRRFDGRPIDPSASPALIVRPDAQEILALHADEIVRSWPVEGGKGKRLLYTGPLGRHYPHEHSAFASDGTLLAANTGDGPVRVRDLNRNGHPVIATIADRSGQVFLFSPDKRFLITAGMRRDVHMPAEERTIRLWELASGKEALRLPLPAGNAVSCLASQPHGRSLVAGMADTTVLIWDLTPGEIRGRLDAAALERTWADLASDAKTAYRAVHLLASSPAEAVPFLSAHLRPVTPPNAERLARLLANLDDDAFAVRERAERELEKLGELAEPVLRKELTKRPPLEVRRRIEGLLAKLDKPAPLSPAGLREIRAVMALEWAASLPARRHLRALAKGADEARMTREVRAALRRMVR